MYVYDMQNTARNGPFSQTLNRIWLNFFSVHLQRNKWYVLYCLDRTIVSFNWKLLLGTHEPLFIQLNTNENNKKREITDWPKYSVEKKNYLRRM